MKTLDEFIDEHRGEIAPAINRQLNFVPRQAGCDCPKQGTDHYHGDHNNLDDEDLRQWILSDEGLYLWAQREGVEI